jgi:crotonobetainyl-CoA:carnitine CoA-transferase CaiB-like acyl-CoA transferase
VDACVEPVLSPDEAFTSGLAAGFLAEQASGGHRFASPGCPVRLRDTPPAIRRSAPRLGEHTREVLAEAGYSADQIEGMHEAGAVA